MPRVPELTPSVQSRALPVGRLGQITPEATGAGLARGLADAAAVTGQIEQRERQRANEVAVTDAERKVDEWESALILDPESGALTKRKKDALNLTPTVLEELDNRSKDLATGLSNSDQRRVFDALWQNRRKQMETTLQRHESNEREAFDADTAQAVVGDAANKAATFHEDLARSDAEIDRGVNRIRERGGRRGAGADEINLLVDEWKSKTRGSVIDAMATAGNADGAREYLDKHKDDLLADDLKQAKRNVGDANDRQKIQQLEDEIMLKAADDPVQALRLARGTAPELRDQVVDAVNARLREDQYAQQLQGAQQAESALTQFDNAGGRVKGIAPSLWRELSLQERRGFELREQQLHAGQEPVTDWNVLQQTKLMDQTDLANINPQMFRPYLSNRHYEGLLNDIRRARQPNNVEFGAGPRSAHQQLMDAMRGGRVIPQGGPTTWSASEQARANAFSGAYEDQLAEFVLENKRPASFKERQLLLDEMMTLTVREPNIWTRRANEKEIPIAALTAEERTSEAIDQSAFYIPFEEISPAEANLAEAFLLDQRNDLLSRGEAPPEEIELVIARERLGQEPQLTQRIAAWREGIAKDAEKEQKEQIRAELQRRRGLATVEVVDRIYEAMILRDWDAVEEGYKSAPPFWDFDDVPVRPADRATP